MIAQGNKDHNEKQDSVVAKLMFLYGKDSGV